jgi:hypothetical protein
MMGEYSFIGGFITYDVDFIVGRLPLNLYKVRRLCKNTA